MSTKKKSEQGKRSTGDTNASYKRDTMALRNSATTSQSSATSQGDVGSGGVLNRYDEEAGSTGKTGTKK